MDDDVINASDIESVRGALDELFLLARRYRRSSEFRDLLRFVSSFRRYSAFNAMLVHIQMPGAKYVLPAKRWFKEYGRLPIPNAQPLVMFQPMSPVMFGFDVSQTEGPDLPEGFENPFEARGSVGAGEFNKILENVRSDGISVTMRPLGSTLGGYVRNAASPHHSIGIGLVRGSPPPMSVRGNKIAVIAEITLNSNLPASTNFATLAHELGHLYCGHVGTPDGKNWPDRRELPLNAREFEAESVSYLVCERAGIETPSAEYLHGYLEQNELLPPISLEAIFKATKRIEAMC